MPVYHVVLFKLKPGTSAEQVAEMKAAAEGMVGGVPGLQKLSFGPPHPSTSHRAQGFDIGVVAVLDSPEHIKIYAEHPLHQKVLPFTKTLCSDALAFDMEF